MKQLSLLIVLFFVCAFVQSQYIERGFMKAGFHAGMPTSQSADFSSFTFGFDFFQHYGISEEFDIGFATGFTNAFGKTEQVQVGDFSINGDFNNLQFIPAAALLRYYPQRYLNIGADVGYALALNQGLGGGLYYRPTINFDVTENTGFYVSYTNIELEELKWSTITGGLIFTF
ncbi:hypothetical protein [Croceivirga thetidis]|uniref:Outer membrane protein beta-barrel domain-containing protein n=1 Tax=Croceivirga thetidis TaxID=2721623 RepID=A0ABX1GQF4_9FLAO|nr:hypothetical protein [Croceivirga thetidis]NKI31893.1 hypothetical protein [Croceivirga thetidis]